VGNVGVMCCRLSLALRLRTGRYPYYHVPPCIMPCDMTVSAAPQDTSDLAFMNDDIAHTCAVGQSASTHPCIRYMCGMHVL